ncbi:hypothetical protein BC830DRAFT_1083004 [Chytriomyces sp. MP71]|nr:hypothetical protein BC830DRAFT_1083004 [Chytriomyces sp. MP71]
MLSLAILDIVLTIILVRFIGGYVLSYLPDCRRQVTETGSHCHKEQGRQATTGCQNSCRTPQNAGTTASSGCPMRQAKPSGCHLRQAKPATSGCPPFPFTSPRFQHFQMGPAGLPLEILQALIAQDTPIPRPAPASTPAASSAPVPASATAASRTEQPKPTVCPTHTFVDNAKSFTLTVDVPGFKRGEIALTVTDDTRLITVAGTSQTRNPVELKLVVPRLGDLKSVVATVEDGVLTVVVPKLERDGHVVEVLASVCNGEAAPSGASDKAVAGYEFA